MDAHAKLAFLGWGLAFASTLPMPDGSIGPRDQQQYLNLPSAPEILPAFETPATNGMIQVKPFRAQDPDQFISAYYDILGGSFGSHSSAITPIGACDATLRNFRPKASTSPGAGSYICTVMVDNVDTAMVATITAGNLSPTFPGSITVPAGKQVKMRVTPSGGPAALNGFGWSVDHVGDNPGESSYTSLPGGGGFNAGNTRRAGVFRATAWVDDATHFAHFASPVPCFGAITKLYWKIYNAAIAPGDTITIHVWKSTDGGLTWVKQDGSGGTPDTGVVMTSASAVYETPDLVLNCTPGDLLYFEGVHTGGNSSASAITPGVRFKATTNGQSIVSGVSLNLGTANGTTEYASPSVHGVNWGGEAGIDTIDGAITPFGLKHLFVERSVPPGSGDSDEFRPRLNAANPSGGQVVTISGTATPSRASDTEHSFSVVDGDVISFRHVVSGTPDVGRVVWAMIMETAVSGGDQIPPGTNPPAGDPVGQLYFARFRMGEDSFFAAQTLLRDASTSFEGKKAAELAFIGEFEQLLLREGNPRSSLRLRVIDVPDADGTMRWRGFTKSRMLENVFVELFQCDAPYGEIVGTPYREWAGYITPAGFTATDPGLFEFEALDAHSVALAEVENPPQIPGDPVTIGEYAGLDPNMDGKEAPIVFGHCVEDGVGVIKAVRMGQINPSVRLHPDGVDDLYDVFLISRRYVYDIPNIYINTLVWGKDEAIFAGELRIPPPDQDNPYVFKAANDGTTGGSAPTFSTTPGTPTSDNGITWDILGTYDPTLRYPVPADVYAGGLEFTHSHAANWTAVTGLTDPWVDDGTPAKRYTIALIRSSNRYAKAWREGRVVPLFDVDGVTTNPGSGPPILSPEYLDIYLGINFQFAKTDGITAGAMPMFPGLLGDYSAYDTDSADASKALDDANGGTICGFSLGADGESQGLFEVQSALQVGGGFFKGIQRHGQRCYARRPPSDTPPVATITTQRGITTAKYSYDGTRRGYEMQYRFGLRYADPFPPPPAPEPGDPLVAIGDRPTMGEWASGLQRILDTAARDALEDVLGRPPTKPPLRRDNKVVRDAGSAFRVANEDLNYAVGPAPLHGTELVTIEGPRSELVLRLGNNGKTRAINDVISLVDESGNDAQGYDGKPCWILSIKQNLETERAVITAEILRGPDVIAVP